jgi:hypothetical protein
LDFNETAAWLLLCRFVVHSLKLESKSRWAGPGDLTFKLDRNFKIREKEPLVDFEVEPKVYSTQSVSRCNYAIWQNTQQFNGLKKAWEPLGSSRQPPGAHREQSGDKGVMTGKKGGPIQPFVPGR